LDQTHDLYQGSATYVTRAKLGTPSNFQLHAGAPWSTYQFCHDPHRWYIDLDLYKNTYVVGTLNDLKYSVGTQLAKSCRPLICTMEVSEKNTGIQKSWDVAHHSSQGRC